MTGEPWPRYPCHDCSSPDTHCGVRRYGPEIGEVSYGWATDYAWHSACWDKITGKWRAVCCKGHVLTGRTR